MDQRGSTGVAPPIGGPGQEGGGSATEQAGQVAGAAKEQATQVAGAAKEQVGQVAGTTKEQVGQVAGTAAEQAGQVAGTAAEQASAVAGTAAEQASAVASTAKEQVAAVTGDAFEQARTLFTEAKGQASTTASEQVGRAAEALRTLSQQARALADGRVHEAGPVKDQVSMLADRLGTVASRVDERGVDGLLEDVRRFARRRPGAFLVAAGAVGFGVGVLLRGAKAGTDGGSQGSFEPQRSYGELAPSAPPVLPPVDPAAALVGVDPILPAESAGIVATPPYGEASP